MLCISLYNLPMYYCLLSLFYGHISLFPPPPSHAFNVRFDYHMFCTRGPFQYAIICLGYVGKVIVVIEPFVFLCNFQVFDISALQIFSPMELDYLLCGRRELWEVILLFPFDFIITSCNLETYIFYICVFKLQISFLMQPESLVDHIKFDHGYTAKSPAILNVCYLNHAMHSPFFSPYPTCPNTSISLSLSL